MHLCRIESTIEICGCIPADAPDLNISSWNVPICSKEGMYKHRGLTIWSLGDFSHKVTYIGRYTEKWSILAYWKVNEIHRGDFLSLTTETGDGLIHV